MGNRPGDRPPSQRAEQSVQVRGVFTCETLADAKNFRDRFRAGSAVYEVQCEDGAICRSQLAISYWRDPPTGIKEILVGGPVTVVAQVA